MSTFAALVLFLVYLNVPAVVVRELGLPFIVGAAVPLLLIIPLLHTLILRGEPLRLPALMIAATVLLVVQAVSALHAPLPEESLTVVIEWALEGVVLAAFIVNVFRTRADVIAAANALVLACAVMGIIVLLQQATGNTDRSLFGFGQIDAAMVDDHGDVQRRLAGPIGETNRFAQVMAVVIPIAASLAVGSSGIARFWYAVATVLITGGMALAYSRGAIVALLLTVPFAVLFGVAKLRHVMVGIVAIPLLLLASPQYADRVSTIGQVAVQALGLAPGGVRNADGAARGRLTEMKSSALIFLDHPLLGAGPGMAQVLYVDYAPIVGGKVRSGERESHNLYLQLAAETGLTGLAAFAAVVYFAFAGLERARKRLAVRDPVLWGIVCGLELALIVHLTTSLFLHASYVRYLWMLLGLCVAAAGAGRAPVLIRLLGRMLTQTAARVRSST